MDRREFLMGTAAAGAVAMAVKAAPALAASPDSIESRLDAYFAPFVEARDYGGIILMERGGRLLASRAYGRANLEFDVPHTPDTKYMTASISKMFTRASVIALEKAGRLSQDDKLSRFLPSYPRASDISIRQIVEHHAGIARDLIFESGGMQPKSTSELVEMIARIPPIAEPGTDQVYSNNGYRLLARVIELAGGGGYDDLVRELVFEPRGMRDTVPGGLLEVIPRKATGYVPDFGWKTLRQASPVQLANHKGAGSFYTTPNDLLRFARDLPLERADLDSAARTNPDGSPKQRAVGHDGLGFGFANLCYNYPDEDARLVVMGNVETGLFGPMHADMRKILFSEAVTPPPAQEAVNVELDRQKAAQAYAGSYNLRPGFPLVVRLTERGLAVSAGDDFHPLQPLGDNRFFMRLKHAHITFNGGGATADSITWKEAGFEFTLDRLA